MKKWNKVALVLLLSLSWFLSAIVVCAKAQTLPKINAKGVGGQPICVQQTPTTILDPWDHRLTWTANWIESGDLMCEPIVIGAIAPPVQPSLVVGFRITRSNVPWTSSEAPIHDAILGCSCVCTVGSCNVYTYEW